MLAMSTVAGTAGARDGGLAMSLLNLKFKRRKVDSRDSDGE